MEGATPHRGGVSGGPKGEPLTPPRWRISAEKGGGRSLHFPPSCAAPRRAVRGGDNSSRRRTTLYRRGFEESVPPRFQCGFPGTAWTTTARGRPLREERWGCQKRAPPDAPPPPFSVALEYDGTALTPGGGNRRSIPLRPRTPFPPPPGRSCPRRRRGHHGVRPAHSVGLLWLSGDEPHSLSIPLLCQVLPEWRTPVWLPSHQSVF